MKISLKILILFLSFGIYAKDAVYFVCCSKENFCASDVFSKKNECSAECKGDGNKCKAHKAIVDVQPGPDVKTRYFCMKKDSTAQHITTHDEPFENLVECIQACGENKDKECKGHNIKLERIKKGKQKNA